MARIVGLVVMLLVGWVVLALNTRPSVDAYQALATAPAETASGMRVTFLGVSTLLVRGESAAILVDGFFTRPGLLRTALGRIAPDHQRVAQALEHAQITHLDAVVTAHSHYDHAMDAPEVARRTGALLVGSESTANIARGQGIPEDRIHVVRGTDTLRFGDLSVTLVPSRHFPHNVAMGEIASPLLSPAGATDYREGGTFSILVERAGRSILVQSSAGFAPGGLAGRHAEVVYLGVGLLGEKDDGYRDAYWRETVAAVGARRVIPIHWDDFTRGLDLPLVALPQLFDDLGESMEFLTARAGSEGVDVRWPVLWQQSDPFAGL